MSKKSEEKAARKAKLQAEAAARGSNCVSDITVEDGKDLAREMVKMQAKLGYECRRGNVIVAVYGGGEQNIMTVLPLGDLDRLQNFFPKDWLGAKDFIIQEHERAFNKGWVPAFHVAMDGHLNSMQCVSFNPNAQTN